ncbi:heparinase II/III family protein [Rossellomorea sp. NPDC077527]|uniref:heparinase II/III domain-containing protein n=1 Tax=Rossellomorea sp. NPDC077527 TaxID=3364510 RepID=UPI0037C5477C
MIKKSLLVFVCFMLLVPTIGDLPKSTKAEETSTVISDFEHIDDWSGLEAETELVKEGIQAGRWDVVNEESGKTTKAVETTLIPHDWSGNEVLNMWIHSKQETEGKVYVILESNDPSTTSYDYYITSINIDWRGWKQVSLPYYIFKAANSPKGFSSIDKVKLHTSWYQETPNPEIELVLDHFTITSLGDVDVLPLSGFEDMSKWTSLSGNTTYVKEGRYSGKWSSIDTKTNVQTYAVPKDWSRYDRIDLWMYSEKATGTPIYVIIDADNPETSGMDYYMNSVTVDWQGWKQVSLEKSRFTASRQPLGWDQVNRLMFHSFWYASQPPDPETVLYLDDLKLIRETFKVSPDAISKSVTAEMNSVSYKVFVTNNSDKTDEYVVKVPEELTDSITVDESEGELSPGESKMITIHVDIDKTTQIGEEVSMTIPITSRIQLDADFNVKLSYTMKEWSRTSHERPKSFFGKAELERAKERIQNEQWASGYWTKLKAEADQWITRDLTIPTLGGGHGMWYYCGVDAPLEYDPDSPHRHYCPADGKYYTGDTYDAGWRWKRHNEIITALKDLSVAYSLSGNLAYGEKARGILLEYVDMYPNYEKQTRGGRLYWQTLDEAVSMVDVSLAYDLLYDSGILSDQDKMNIELNFLRPSAVTLSEYDMGRSNWQAWHNAAIGMIGFVLGEQEYIDFAINGEHGFYYLMDNSVLRDGFWWEGAISYHMYTLRALNVLAEGAKQWGYDLYANPTLEKMFDLPVEYAYPDFGLPMNNDGGQYGESLVGPVSPKGSHEYEAAYAYYQKNKYLNVLNQRYAKNPREGLYALFTGVDQLATAESVNNKGKNFEGVGHSILRAGADMFSLIDYGDYGGSHGHPDKLHLDLFGKGARILPDFGTPSYGNFLYRDWYKQTISHNTVTVDGKTQEESSGELDFYVNTDGIKMMKASSNDSYSGVTYNRTVLTDEDYVVDWFLVTDPSTMHQYDWAVHPIGTFSTELPLKQRTDALGNEDGYQIIQKAESAESEEQVTSSWIQESTAFHLTSLLYGNREIIIGEAPGPSNESAVNIPFMIQRQSGNDARFVHVMQIADKADPVYSVEKLDDRCMRIDKGTETDYICYNPNAENGQLVAAKVTVGEGSSFSILEHIGLKIQNGNLQVQLNHRDKVKAFTLMIKNERANNIRKVNGPYHSEQIDEMLVITKK